MTQEQRHTLVNELRYGLLDSTSITLLQDLQPFIGRQHLADINKAIHEYFVGSKYYQPFLCTKFFKPRCPPKFLVMGGSTDDCDFFESYSPSSLNNIHTMFLKN